MKKKMIITVFIGIIFIIFFGYYLIQSLSIMENNVDITTKILMSLPSIGAIGCIILVVKQRFDELRKGEEDDLDNY